MILMLNWIIITALLLFLSFIIGSVVEKKIEREIKAASPLYIPHLDKCKNQYKNALFSKKRKGVWLSLITLCSFSALVGSIISGYSPYRSICAVFFDAPDLLPPMPRTVDYFIVDCSGSMSQPFSQGGSTNKLESVQKSIAEAIQKSDKKHSIPGLIGINTFARFVTTVTPLTYDRYFLIDNLKGLSAVQKDELNGTSTGYAVYKTVAQLVATKLLSKADVRTAIYPRCILISDGIEEPHPSDRSSAFRSIRLLQALDFASENGVSIDYIMLGKGITGIPKDEKARIIQAIYKTGGNFREVNSEHSLSAAIGELMELHDAAHTEVAPTRHPSDRGREFLLLGSLGFCLIWIVRLASARANLRIYLQREGVKEASHVVLN